MLRSRPAILSTQQEFRELLGFARGRCRQSPDLDGACAGEAVAWSGTVCFAGLLCVRELILYLSFTDVQIKYTLGGCHCQKHHPL